MEVGSPPPPATAFAPAPCGRSSPRPEPPDPWISRGSPQPGRERVAQRVHAMAALLAHRHVRHPGVLDQDLYAER